MKRAPEKLRFAAMAVDAVVFAIVDGELKVLLGDVHSDSPYHGMKAFLGGLILETENADEALVRILKNKGNLAPTYFEQLYTFSEVDRDKRNRVVSVAYLAFVRPDTAQSYKHEIASFVSIKEAVKLGYDHDEMLKMAVARLKGKLSYTNVAQFLLPRYFTLTELQTVYEIVLGAEIDKRNFRKKIMALDIVRDTGTMQEGVKNRPAALYEFTSNKLKELSPIV